jgi:DNA polymerase I-like protein with 3'-5' exonuclease and polymerase domains
MAEGLVRLAEALPFDAYGPNTGIVNQCHDAVTVEVPEAEGERVCAILEEALSARYEQLPGVVFSVEAQTAQTWKDAA